MINDQIIWWINKNKTIYYSKDLSGYLNKNTKHSEEEQFKQLMKSALSQLCRLARKWLINGKNITLKNFITFYTVSKSQQNTNHLLKSPRYVFQGTIISHIKILLKQKRPKDNECFNINKQIASFLLIQQKIVQQLIKIYVRAINDLLSLDKRLEICLSFCKIKLGPSQATCLFEKSFLLDLNKYQETKPNYKETLYTCLPNKCINPNKLNIYEKINEINQLKYQEIKEGNLFNKPSLVEIKNHFQKGKNLYLKYQSYFQ